jgi:hypothetical protein
VIVFQLSKLWGKWLLASQYVNLVLLLLSAFISAADVPVLASWKTHAIEIHAAIAGFVATLQAMAKSLTDSDGNGTPDIFEPTSDA